MKLVTLAAGEAHVWLFMLDRAPREVDRLRGLLSDAERERAGPLPLWTRKRRYTVRQGTVREILARYAGCAPEELELTRTSRGKPALADGPPFSVSDSGGLGLVALASCEVGADLERVVDRPVARRSRSRSSGSTSIGRRGKLGQRRLTDPFGTPRRDARFIELRSTSGRGSSRRSPAVNACASRPGAGRPSRII